MGSLSRQVKAHIVRSAKKMGPKTKELIEVLSSIIELLESGGETHWVAWMRKSKSRLEASDFSGITHLLEAYGGMESFNDLIICQQTIEGILSWKYDYIEKNDERLNKISKFFV